MVLPLLCKVVGNVYETVKMLEFSSETVSGPSKNTVK